MQAKLASCGLYHLPPRTDLGQMTTLQLQPRAFLSRRSADTKGQTSVGAVPLGAGLGQQRVVVTEDLPAESGRGKKTI